MELNQTETTFASLKKIFETSSEQSVDTDFTLPDYYPEVSRVLKCMTDINILSAQLKDGAVNVGGQAVITLLYADHDNGLNSFTHVCPFTKSVETTANAADAFVDAVPRINYINSKATGPRKLEVHGSLSIGISVLSVENDKILTEIDGEGIYSKCAEYEVAEPLTPVSKSIFAEDDITIGQNKPTVGKILRSSSFAKISECKFVSSKIVVKGELTVGILYSPSQPGRPVYLSEQHGFSQIIDCDGMDENCRCDAFAEVISLELHPKTSLDGEVKSIGYEAKIKIDIFPYRLTAKSVISDVFSGRYEATVTGTKIFSECFADTVSENYVCKKNLDFTGGMLNDIFDLWCRSTVDYASGDGGDLLIKGSVIISIIGNNSDGEPVFFERPVDYEYRCAIDGASGGLRCRPTVYVAAVNYSQNANGGVEVSVELSIRATVFTQNEIDAVSEISVDEERMVPKDGDTAVILYFAERETPWQIAKKYGTSPQKICEANGLESFDSECEKILLIPNV